MPQMAPMNWLTLYMLFTMIFFMFNFMNFFIFMMKNNYNNNKLFKKMLTWKW
uniref:ATP synthase complex subunit 8 n=1 Tax=Porhydrus obliquesignatus TaxID=1309536 RepID=A0A894JXC8_9DYTI|nr:ATP synthase F0 subunit 8 [Porhydrus obliquesignatus]QRV62845.1 ATP synthase F0 subunit 8 [Porhydrus obliquesignatus]